MKTSFLLAVCVSLSSGLLRAADDCWQAVNGSYDGKWSENGHWSLGRPPVAGDAVVFDVLRNGGTSADFTVEIDGTYSAGTLCVGKDGSTTRNQKLTFTGSGTVTFTGTADQHVNPCKGIVINGPHLIFNDKSLMLYAPVTVTGGSALDLNYGLIFWSIDDYLTIDDGTVTAARVAYANRMGNRSLLVKENGRFVCSGEIYPQSGTESSTNGFALVVDGGSAEIGTLKLTRPAASVQLKSGSLRLVNRPTYMSESQFVFEGGDLSLGFDIGTGDASLRALLSSGLLDSVECPNAYVPTDGVLESASPLLVTSIRHSNAMEPGSVRCETLVFTNDVPFRWGDSNNRFFDVIGPTTIRPRGDMTDSVAYNAYVRFFGSIVVDTRDWSDGETPRYMHLRGLSSGDGSLELKVCGGGTLAVDPAFIGTVDSLEVAEGTTLRLTDRGTTFEWRPLVIDSLVLGPNAKIELNAGRNYVMASKWTVDPTAKVVVTVPAGFPEQSYSAYPILNDTDGDVLPDSVVGCVTFVAKPDDVFVKNEYGQYSIYKVMTSVGIYGTYEWTGAGADAHWNTPANWHGNPSAVAEKQIHYFGASTVASAFYSSQLGPNKDKYTIKSVEFMTNAVTSFVIDGSKTPTLDSATGIRSRSGVPQIVDISVRYSYPGYFANGMAPLLFAATPSAYSDTHKSGFTMGGANNKLTVSGDVRLGYSAGAVAKLAFGGYAWPMSYPQLTILPQGSMTFSNQSAADLIDTKDSALKVCKNATLKFTTGDFVMQGGTTLVVGYRSHIHDIDGMLTMGAVFHGGNNHAFRGAGTVKFTGGMVSEVADSTVAFGGTVTAELPDWNTATADGAAYALALAAHGRPVFKVADGWTYGPAVGVTPTSAVSKRAFRIYPGAVATLDADGGTVCFVDPFTGSGTLCLTNANLTLDGAFASDTALKVANNAMVTVSGEQEIGAIVMAGGSVALTEDGKLVANGNLSLEGVQVNVGGQGNVWRTLAVSRKGQVSGTPDFGSDDVRTRTVQTAAGCEFQCKPRFGLSVIVK